VKGADVAGVKLSGPITGFAKGQIIIEKNPAEKPIPTCTSDPIATPENILMTAHMINKAQSLEADYRSTPEAAVDQNGSFTLTTLLPGDYSLDAWLPRDDLFIRSISYPNDKTLAQAAVSKGSTTASFDKLTIKSGDTVQGLSIVIGVGASSVTGMVRTDNNGNSDHARVFLVPAEADTAAQTWRYYETKTDEAGKFTIKHIMPGRYWQIAIPIKDNKPTYGQDIVGRSRLKTDAERKGVQISLSSCQKSTDILLIPPKP